MARSSTNVLWSGANTVSVSAGGTNTSDAVAVTANNLVEAALHVKLAYGVASTPASGDTLDCYLALSPDGTDYDSDQPAQLYYLGTIDAADSKLDGTSPGAGWTAEKTFTHLPIAPSNFKLMTKSNGALAGTLSAKYVEVTA